MIYYKNEKNILRECYMTEYFIERDLFRKIWHNIIGDNSEEILDAIEYGFEGDNFKAWYNNEIAYILHKPSGTLLTWYKLTHLGRCISSNRFIYCNNMYRFLRMFRNEVLS